MKHYFVKKSLIKDFVELSQSLLGNIGNVFVRLMHLYFFEKLVTWGKEKWELTFVLHVVFLSKLYEIKKNTALILLRCGAVYFSCKKRVDAENLSG